MIAASSPGPMITRSLSVGNVRRRVELDRYEQCSLQRFRKQPSSTGFGGRFSRLVMISRSVCGSRDISGSLGFSLDEGDFGFGDL